MKYSQCESISAAAEYRHCCETCGKMSRSNIVVKGIGRLWRKVWKDLSAKANGTIDLQIVPELCIYVLISEVTTGKTPPISQITIVHG